MALLEPPVSGQLPEFARKYLSGNKQLFIDGAFAAAQSGKVFPVFNPATGDVLAHVAEGDSAEIDRAVAAARRAFESGPWRSMSPSERSRLIYRLADKLEERLEDFALLESLDNGKPLAVARVADVPMSVDNLRYMAGWATKIVGESIPIPGEFHAYTRREPIGVVGQIIPWNFPLLMAAWKIGPALAAGCTIVLKPAEQTPLTALLLAEIAAEVGFPPGVLNVVPGYGETAGAALANHPDVDKIAFTGSTEVGKLIVKAAAGNLKKVTLELGGKSPVLIFDDADLDKALLMASLGIFVHSGQGCVCGSRIFAQRGVYDQVVAGVAMMANSFKLGAPSEEGCVSGPLISQKQLTRVMGFIDEGKDDGVEVVAGGYRLDRKGYFVHPTVLTNVDPGMRLFQEEIFGPVVSILPFDDEDEAVALANDTTYGLAATVYTENVRRAHRVVKRLKAGSVQINCQLVFDHDVPFGGFKQSGWGHEFGKEGLDIYLKTKSVWAQL